MHNLLVRPSILVALQFEISQCQGKQGHLVKNDDSLILIVSFEVEVLTTTVYLKVMNQNSEL